MAFIVADWLTPVPQGKIGKALKGIRQLARLTKKPTDKKINKHAQTQKPQGKEMEQIAKNNGWTRVAGRKKATYRDNETGNELEWDPNHGGEWEVFDKRGRHLGTRYPDGRVKGKAIRGREQNKNK